MSYKSKLIQQHIALCNANNIAYTQNDINNWSNTPYKYLKGILTKRLTDNMQAKLS